MSRLATIIKSARYTLGDIKGQRYSDDRLVMLVDEAQKDLCRHANLLKAEAKVEVGLSDPFIKLPDNCRTVIRALVDDEVLSVTTSNELDLEYPKWRTRTGKPRYLVQERVNVGLLKLYPNPQIDFENISMKNTAMPYTWTKEHKDIPNLPPFESTYEAFSQFPGILVFNDDFGIASAPDGFGRVIAKFDHNDFGIANIGEDFGFIFDGDTDFGLNIDNCDRTFRLHFNETSSNHYGIATKINNFEMIDIYGLCELPDIDAKVISDDYYGLQNGVLEYTMDIAVHYIKKPDSITSIDQEIEIDELYDKAIEHYIVARAFLDDTDLQSRTVGAERLELYNRELKKAMVDTQYDYLSNHGRQLYVSSYFNAFKE